MSSEVIILIAVMVAVTGGGLIYYFGFSGSGRTGMSNSYRNLSASSQRGAKDTRGTVNSTTGKPDLLQGMDSPSRTLSSAQLTIAKRLKYGQLAVPVVAFHACEISLSIMAFMIVRLHMNFVMQALSLLTGPLFMRWLLNLFMDRRFKRFDADYPQFLLSLVGLLKTGMNPMGALETAAQGLEDGSLVKEECEMMMERLRFGVSEDKSIGAFGEDVYHPEIELFVQALLLSRRVGGTLSDTLERLAKQVRKRQHFRNSAVSAVGMQRGSIWVIVFMLFAMQIYLYFMYPDMVVGGLESEMGWEVWQVAIAVILLAIFWVRQVTKIRV